ncbi:MAG: hypothetical protein WAK60_11420 [Sedimentisphaerales bacterium]
MKVSSFQVITVTLAVIVGSACVTSSQSPLPMIYDMVHHNPGEPLYESRYNNPAVIKEMGFNGKVYFLFDSPQLAVDWDPVDPDILPAGSEAEKWVTRKAERLHREYKRCQQAGIQVYAMSDLILFPKRLIEKFAMEKTFGDPKDPKTQKYLRLLLDLMFEQFPELDGLVVRIGETYLHDAPYHSGRIDNKTSAEKTIIPLMQLLREEICVKRNKQLIFRTWLSFDTDLKTYMAVSDAVQPHDKLTFSVKHCEDDFHRANPFSKVLGQGRHKQIVEIQCAREYEGKGAYPNYISNGVIEGFEEHKISTAPNQIKCLRDIYTKSNLLKGIWTWTRGGGWEGPYITNELWPDLNAWVLAQWANNPSLTEESIFNRYASEQLGLKGDSVKKFRQLALLSADAVIRGISSTYADVSPWWTRDQYIGWPELPKEKDKLNRLLAQKDEAVDMWEKIVSLADSIDFPDKETGQYIQVSCRYGLHLYRIYRCVFNLAALEKSDDKAASQKWFTEYDRAWNDYILLKQENSCCATLYSRSDLKRTRFTPAADVKIQKLRKPATE